MYRLRLLLPLAALAGLTALAPAQPDKASTKLLRFRMQEIDTTLKVGYAVLIADLNGDGKPDVVVADTDRVVWYENPTWRRRVIIDKLTKPDNVCLAAYDIDGDGQTDLVLGAGWKPFDTKTPGTLQWLKRGKSIDEPWTVYPIECDEPTVHRIRFADTTGGGKAELILAPLMGRDSSARVNPKTGTSANWMDGRPVRLLAYPIPSDPAKGPWAAKVLDDSLHVVHSVAPVPAERRKGIDLLAASYEGVSLVGPYGKGGRWGAKRIGEGEQDKPQANRGASEVKPGRLKGGRRYVATVEPWHGNKVVVYTPADEDGKLWERQVVDSRLHWGHALWCADLDGDGGDELVVGVRDDPTRADDFAERRGVRVYKFQEDGKRWERQLVDPGGVAVEDLAVGDLNGDGRPDIVAVGRQTGNVRIYWNEK